MQGATLCQPIRLLVMSDEPMQLGSDLSRKNQCDIVDLCAFSSAAEI